MDELFESVYKAYKIVKNISIIVGIAIVIGLFAFIISHLCFDTNKAEIIEPVAIQAPVVNFSTINEKEYSEIKLLVEIENLIQSYNEKKSLDTAEKIIIKQNELIEALKK